VLDSSHGGSGSAAGVGLYTRYAQWLDRSSVQTIRFVSRRLLAERVAIVKLLGIPARTAILAGLPEIDSGILAPKMLVELFDSVVAAPPTQRSGIGSLLRREGIPLPCWSCHSVDDGGLVEGLSESRTLH